MNLNYPKGWESKNLLDCCTKITDGTHDTPMVTNTGRPFYTAIHVRENGIDYDSCLYLSEEDHRLIYQRCNPERGDILLVNIGAGVCTTALVEVDYEFSIKNVALLKPNKSKVDSRFIDQIIKFNRPQILTSLTNGGAQPFLGLGQIGNLVFTMPKDKKEQEAIANALSDADSYIESLEKLIAKKRLIKKGVMQELLTGKCRLPSFSKKWAKSKIGDLLKIEHGRSQKDVESPNGTIPILATGGQIGWANKFLYNKPSVLIGRKGTINKPQYMETPFWTVDTLFYSTVFSPNSAKFLYYRFCLIEWMSLNEASGVPSLNARTIEAIEIEIPEAIEQNQIAQVLTDIDSDIDLLEGRLNKARLLKQGMMQELLTGRIRLI